MQTADCRYDTLHKFQITIQTEEYPKPAPCQLWTNIIHSTN